MKISANIKYQFLFFLILIIYTIFNGGNNNLSIQINFIFISVLFLYLLKNNNFKAHLKYFYKQNKIFIKFYILFLIFILFQILPLPVKTLQVFSPIKYEYLSSLVNDISFISLSLSPSNTFFQFLHYSSLIIVVFLIKMIFYKNLHTNRIYLFLSFFGAFVSLFAIILYFFGNPDFFFIKKVYNYKGSATGFFVNRTTFSIFLLFCFIASLEIQKNLIPDKYLSKNENFFLKIYIRIFIIFITIGIVTSFSRIGNFLLLITICFYLLSDILNKQNKNISFRYLLFVVLIFDIIILGFYFGSEELIDRFSLIQNEISQVFKENSNLSRFQIIKFGIDKIQHFLFFGYGSASFETLFNTTYINNTNYYANHVHSSGVEFLGEFGLIGFTLLIISISKSFNLKKKYSSNKMILTFYIIILLIFDFSLHVPLIQILFVIFFSLNTNSTQLNYRHL